MTLDNEKLLDKEAKLGKPVGHVFIAPTADGAMTEVNVCRP
jgi:hypothetical protein